MITPGTWSWWTSCSWTRLRSEDGSRTHNVLMPAKLSDGQLHIVVTPDDMALIAAAPLMLAELQTQSATCGLCSGTGEHPTRITQCHACRPVRKLIALATTVRP